MEIKGINNNNNIQLLAYKEIKELIVSIKLLLKRNQREELEDVFSSVVSYVRMQRTRHDE